MRYLVFFLLMLALVGPVLGRPRFEVSQPTWSGSLKPGSSVSFQARVINRSKEVSRGVLCVVFLQGRKLGQVVSPSDLAPGGELLLEGSVAVPSDLAEALQSRRPEQVMQLQCSALRVPDLCVADVNVEAVSEGFRWVVTLVNKGAGPVASMPYRLSWDGQTVQQKKLLQALGPGESHQFTFVDRRPAESGKHKAVCQVDPDHELEDSDTSNNQYQLDWQGNSSKADLQIRSWSMEPDKVTVGTPVRILLSLANTGDVEMFKLPVQLKVNGKVELEKKFFQSVVPGGEAELTLNWVPTVAGDLKVNLVCQGQATPTQIITIGPRPGYKLQLVSANVPRRSRQSKDWVIDVQVKNSGSLSSESVRAVLWADGSRVWSTRLPGPLESGQEATLNLRWSAQEPGKRQLRIELTGQGPKADEDADVQQLYPVEVEPGEEE